MERFILRHLVSSFLMAITIATGWSCASPNTDSAFRNEREEIQIGYRISVIAANATISNESGEKQDVVIGETFKVRKIENGRFLVGGDEWEGWLSETDVISLSDAHDYFREYLDKFPNDANAKFGMAEYWRRLDFAKAVEWYSECLKDNPKHYLALCNRGFCRYKLGDGVNSKIDLEQAIATNPVKPLAYQRLSQYLMGMPENIYEAKANAREPLLQALKINPQFGSIHYELVRLHFDRRYLVGNNSNDNAVLFHMKAARSLQPHDVPAINMESHFLEDRARKVGDVEAVSILRKRARLLDEAITIDPFDHYCRRERAVLAAESENFLTDAGTGYAGRTGVTGDPKKAFFLLISAVLSNWRDARTWQILSDLLKDPSTRELVQKEIQLIEEMGEPGSEYLSQLANFILLVNCHGMARGIEAIHNLHFPMADNENVRARNIHRHVPSGLRLPYDKHGRTAMNVLMEDHLVTALYVLCFDDPDLDQQRQDGNTLLHESVRSDDLFLTQMLLLRGASLEVKSQSDHTPLQLALQQDDLTLAHLLINERLKSGQNHSQIFAQLMNVIYERDGTDRTTDHLEPLARFHVFMKSYYRRKIDGIFEHLTNRLLDSRITFENAERLGRQLNDLNFELLTRKWEDYREGNLSALAFLRSEWRAREEEEQALHAAANQMEKFGQEAVREVRSVFERASLVLPKTDLLDLQKHVDTKTQQFSKPMPDR